MAKGKLIIMEGVIVLEKNQWVIMTYVDLNIDSQERKEEWVFHLGPIQEGE